MALSKGKIVFIILAVVMVIYLILVTWLAYIVAESRDASDYYCKGYSNGTLIDGYPKGSRYVNLYKLDKCYTMDNISFDKGVLYTIMPMDNSTRQLYVSCNRYIENYLRLSQQRITNDDSKYEQMVPVMWGVILGGLVVIALIMVVIANKCRHHLRN